MATNIQPIREGILWIDVTDPTTGEIRQISEDYGLNQHIVRDCLQPEHLPKYEYVEEVHFLILRYYARQSDKRVATLQDLTNKIAIFFTPRFIITIHKSELTFLDVIRKKQVAAGKSDTTSDVLILVAWQTLETFEDPADRLSGQIDFYESQIMGRKATSDQMEGLYTIKREASIAHKALMLMGEPINHIRPDPGDEAALQDVRDQHLKMHTLYGQVLEDVNNLMNLFLSFSSQRTNDIMRVLTIFSVFFMPLTFIAGIYGMNFQYMPELGKKWGYPSVLILMVVVTAGIYLWFRRKKWL